MGQINGSMKKKPTEPTPISNLKVSNARKILGKSAKGISDEQLEKDIEIAELLKNLFFDLLTNSDKLNIKYRSRPPNMP